MRHAISILLCYLAIGIPGHRAAMAQAPANPSRPNVLLIVADDMNAWSVRGNYPALKTPAIDKLKSQSLNFLNATCAAPVCIPSRASFFSGLYPHNTGIYLNARKAWFNTKVSETEVIPELFKRNGYTTWGRGKIFHVEINADREPKMFDNNVVKGGFGPYAAKPFWYGASRWYSVKPWEGPDTDFPDVTNADAAISFLQQAHEKPFFMYYGMWRPHTPYTAPKRFFDLYADTEITLPPDIMENDLDDVPQPGRDLVDSLQRYHKQGLTKDQVLHDLLRAYCANTSFADWNIGRILDALDNSPHAANTIVIFVSDNGFHNGAKNHWIKATLWEQADIVPFLVRLPDGQAFRCPQTASLIDLYPTLVEYCRLTPPKHQLDGKSLVPVFENPHHQWQRPGFTTYGEHYSSVRDEHYRYIRYPDGSDELYDHRTDPYEHDNIADQPEMQTVIGRLEKAIPSYFEPSIGGRREVKGNP